MSSLNQPLTEIFSKLSINQRCAIYHLLYSVAVCDNSNDQREINYVNKYLDRLNVPDNDCEFYVDRHGIEGMMNDLKSLNQTMKEFLVVASYELICVDGKMNEMEAQFLERTFIQFGITPQEIVAVIKKLGTLFR